MFCYCSQYRRSHYFKFHKVFMKFKWHKYLRLVVLAIFPLGTRKNSFHEGSDSPNILSAKIIQYDLLFYDVYSVL